jgi:hypothetical protein
MHSTHTHQLTLHCFTKHHTLPSSTAYAYFHPPFHRHTAPPTSVSILFVTGAAQHHTWQASDCYKSAFRKPRHADGLCTRPNSLHLMNHGHRPNAELGHSLTYAFMPWLPSPRAEMTVTQVSQSCTANSFGRGHAE